MTRISSIFYVIHRCFQIFSRNVNVLYQLVYIGANWSTFLVFYREAVPIEEVSYSAMLTKFGTLFFNKVSYFRRLSYNWAFVMMSPRNTFDDSQHLDVYTIQFLLKCFCGCTG